MSGIPRRALDEGVISPAKLVDAVRYPRYFDQRFRSVGPISTSINFYGDPVGSTGTTNLVHFRGFWPAYASYHIKGAGQTILAPYEDAATGSLLAGLDVAASEGVEYFFGVDQTAGNPYAFTVGTATEKNKFIRLEFKLGDASEVADAAVGFRIGENFTANLDDYTDLAVLNANAGTVNVETILNDGTTSTTDTGNTVADNTLTKFEVQLIGANPKFFVNDVEVEVAFTFDTGDVIVPFIFFVQTAGTGSNFQWKRLTFGNIEDDNESLQF